jgi:hypothetical protein
LRSERGLRAWRTRRREAKEARRAQAEQLRLAALVQADAALAQAAEILETSWIQGAWFHVRGGDGRTAALGPLDLHRLRSGTVTGACLVGAVVQATGGPDNASSEIPGRALDALWDALQGELGHARSPVCARGTSPTARTLRVQELTRWNDSRSRTRTDVLRLVDDARVQARQAVATARAPMSAGSAG